MRPHADAGSLGDEGATTTVHNLFAVHPLVVAAHSDDSLPQPPNHLRSSVPYNSRRWKAAPQEHPSTFSAETITVSRYTVLLKPSVRVCHLSQTVSLNDNFPASKQCIPPIACSMLETYTVILFILFLDYILIVHFICRVSFSTDRASRLRQKVLKLYL